MMQKEVLRIICSVLGVQEHEISDIKLLKKGMTNHSFLFEIKGKKYILRMPGEGTEKLINRKEEYNTYETIRDKDICDVIVYINPDNGYKITEYIEGARTCNSFDINDLRLCMQRLKRLHEMELEVGHEVDIFGMIEFYEALWKGKPSEYKDYRKVKENVFSLKKYIDKHCGKKVLTHIDAVPDNFLFTPDGDIRLIDWEYAGMQDPHIDIAMFGIYALFDKKQIDLLIDLYFENDCSKEIRIKIYCYVAVCGLLWSNWCECKRNYGIEFGEYALRQYQYAKDFYEIVKGEISEQEK